jgi:hypothetical protein
VLLGTENSSETLNFPTTQPVVSQAKAIPTAPPTPNATGRTTKAPAAHARPVIDFPPWLWAVAVAVPLLIGGAVLLWQRAEHLASARGGLTVDTIPEGATVKLGGEDEQTTPATFKSERLGSYPLHITLDGYEPVDQTAEIKENEFTDLGTVTLTRSTGSLQITTDPPGLAFAISQGGTVVKSGQTSATVAGLPTGSYDLSVKRGDWQVTATTVIKRNETASWTPDVSAGSVAITSSPSGATVFLDQKDMGKTPLELKDLQPGQVSLGLRLSDYKPASVNVIIEKDKQASATVSLKAKQVIPKELSNLLATWVIDPSFDLTGGDRVNSSGSIRIFLDDNGILHASGGLKEVVHTTEDDGTVVHRDNDCVVTGAVWKQGMLILQGTFSTDYNSVNEVMLSNRGTLEYPFNATSDRIQYIQSIKKN